MLPCAPERVKPFQGITGARKLQPDD